MLILRRLRGPSSRKCSLMVTGYLADLDGSIRGEWATAAITGLYIIIKYDMDEYVYIIDGLSADCRRPVA